MDEQKKYDLRLLKYLREQPSKTIGEKSYARDMIAAEKIRAFFVKTNLQEIAERSMMRNQFKFGIAIDAKDFNISLYTTEQIDLALCYRSQLRMSKNNDRAFLLLADYIPRMNGRDFNLFVSSWFHFDLLFYRVFFIVIGICAFFGIIIALEKSHILLDYIFVVVVTMLVIAGIIYGFRYCIEKNYIEGFVPVVVDKV